MATQAELTAARAAVAQLLKDADVTWVSDFDPSDLSDLSIDGPLDFEEIIAKVLDAAEQARK